MTERRLVVTSCMTETGRRYGEVTIPLMQAYARKCNADFHVNYVPRVICDFIGYQKQQYIDLLKVYDRILHIDIDMVVRSNTPNLFDMAFHAVFAAVDELPYQDLTKEYPPIDRVADIELLGSLPHDTPIYFNVGLFLFSHNSAHILHRVLSKGAEPYFKEQTEMNWLLNWDVHQGLSPKFNHMKLMDDAGLSKDDAYIIHYAGAWGGLCVDKVVEMMKKDVR